MPCFPFICAMHIIICTAPYVEQKQKKRQKTNSCHNNTDTANKHRAVSKPYHFLTENSIIEHHTFTTVYRG